MRLANAPPGGARKIAAASPLPETEILDAVRERRPPFSFEAVTEEYAKLIRQYPCTTVYGDRYGGEWPREQFQKHGVNYEPAERTKSELYKDLLPLLNSQAVDLLDNERLVSQLVSLERRTTRGGRDSIDHLPGAHDDLANAVAGALVTVFSDRATQKQGERERISPLPSRPTCRSLIPGRLLR